jgi:HEAT repeat protein
MGAKRDKRCRERHSASRAACRPDGNEKKSILEVYARIENKKKPYDIEVPPEFSEGGEEPRIGELLEAIFLPSGDIQLVSLKELGRVIPTLSKERSRLLIPYITPLLKETYHEDIRCESIKLLGKIGDTSPLPHIAMIAKTTDSPRLKEEAVRAIGVLKGRRYLEFISDLLQEIYDEPVAVRKAAAFAIGRIDPKGSIWALVESAINDPSPEVRRTASITISNNLPRLERETAKAVVLKMSAQIHEDVEQDEDVRVAVVNMMSIAIDDIFITELMECLKNDPSPRVRGEAANALSHYFSPDIERALIDSFNKEDGEARERIALAIAQYAMKNPLVLHDEICSTLIEIQKTFPRGSYIWKVAVKALPAI